MMVTKEVKLSEPDQIEERLTEFEDATTFLAEETAKRLNSLDASLDDFASDLAIIKLAISALETRLNALEQVDES